MKMEKPRMDEACALLPMWGDHQKARYSHTQIIKTANPVDIGPILGKDDLFGHAQPKSLAAATATDTMVAMK
jgi:hypothetical protein